MATKKGFQVLFDVLPQLFSEFPELHVVVAGGGDRYEEFRRLAQKMPPRIHLPGPVLHDALPELYRAADLFVLPAVHDPKGNVDGLPNVILEAMASGLPVVASSISGIPLAVVDGQTGRLLKEGDREALFRALVELVRSPELRQAWGRAARERAVTELSWDRVAGRYLEFYEETLKGLGAPARPADPRAKGKA
jgi:glycosyltransferase involved in cell wall biosynthesis